MGAYGGIWWADRADRFGHWASSALIVAIVGVIAVGVVPPPARSVAAVCLPLTLFALVIVSWLKMREHDRRLCEWCAQAIPLNAAEVAARLHHRFTIAHAAARRSFVALYLTLLIGSNGLLWFGPFGRIGWAIVQSSMIYLVLAYSSHRRFQPWCPQCREGNGGRERSSAPDPLPQGGIT